MARKQSRVLKQQKIAAVTLAVLVVAVAGYFSWVTVDEAPRGEFIEGEHYVLVDNPRRIRSGQIEVMEFFSYACVHCYNFDRILYEWVLEKGDTIKFVQTPSVVNEFWRLLGRNFLSYQQLGEKEKYHMPFFRAVHDARRTFPDPDSLADFYEQQGGDRDAFMEAYNSPGVASEIARADSMARRLKISAVPAIVVQGKYLIRTSGSVGPKRMLDVMDYLIEKELAEQTAGESPANE